jgi:hypothetical protein
MKGYSLDPHPQINIADRHFAVIYSRRKKRDRFPETIVTVYEDKLQALENASADNHLHAAEVIGPARSSEGIKIYYLLAWIEEENI